jgi:hypothetical protein
MTYILRGEELPKGTVVYFGSDDGQRVCRSIILDDRNKFMIVIFDPADGFWATKWAREIWKRYPHRRPSCTLFEMLTKKLEI